MSIVSWPRPQQPLQLNSPMPTMGFLPNQKLRREVNLQYKQTKERLRHMQTPPTKAKWSLRCQGTGVSVERKGQGMHHLFQLFWILEDHLCGLILRAMMSVQMMDFSLAFRRTGVGTAFSFRISTTVAKTIQTLTTAQLPSVIFLCL